MSTKRRHDHDLECPIKNKKQRSDSFNGCFSFCIYNNALYDASKTNNYFEKRYLDGLLTNIKKIDCLDRDWSLIIYADSNLQHYYSNFHKKQFIDLLMDYDIDIEIHWVVNKYMKYTAFALERFRPISNPVYSIVVVRDVDQLITSLDVSYINELIDSDQHDTLCYRTSNMAFICGGGGFATKKTGQTYIDIEETRHMYVHEYITKHYEDGIGYEEFWMTMNHKHKKINLGAINVITTVCHGGAWYVGNNAVFTLPYF